MDVNPGGPQSGRETLSTRMGNPRFPIRRAADRASDARINSAQQLRKLEQEPQRIGPPDVGEKLEYFHKSRATPFVLEYGAVVGNEALNYANNCGIAETFIVISLFYAAPQQYGADGIKHHHRITRNDELVQFNQV
jgi:hypothetical protein